MTLGDVVHTAKLNKLRFYLTTKLKGDNAESREEESFPAISSPEHHEGSSGSVNQMTSTPISEGLEIKSFSFAEMEDMNLVGGDNMDDPLLVVDAGSIDPGTRERLEVSCDGIVYSELQTTQPSPIINICVNRGQVLGQLEDCITSYGLTSIAGVVVETKMIAMNGEPEMGEDNGGVFRDCLTEYWNAFYTARCTGDNLKIPSVAVKVDGERWSYAGMILALGYYLDKYLPVQLGPAFLQYAMTGIEPAKETLISEFLMYLPSVERDLITTALRDFAAAPKEELE